MPGCELLMAHGEEASCVTEAGDRGRLRGFVCLMGCLWDPVVSSERRVCPGETCFAGRDRRNAVPPRAVPDDRMILAVGCGARSANEGHLVDALALRGDEGRGTLRKARGRCERSLIPGSPNGATHPERGIPC